MVNLYQNVLSFKRHTSNLEFITHCYKRVGGLPSSVSYMGPEELHLRVSEACMKPISVIGYPTSWRGTSRRSLIQRYQQKHRTINAEHVVFAEGSRNLLNQTPTNRDHILYMYSETATRQLRTEERL